MGPTIFGMYAICVVIPAGALTLSLAWFLGLDHSGWAVHLLLIASLYVIGTLWLRPWRTLERVLLYLVTAMSTISAVLVMLVKLFPAKGF